MSDEIAADITSARERQAELLDNIASHLWHSREVGISWQMMDRIRSAQMSLTWLLEERSVQPVSTSATQPARGIAGNASNTPSRNDTTR